MPRYFIALGYKGGAYAGFQVQQNANTVQAEVEKALQVYFREPFSLTGSSRTDTGVHAKQNYFHFDTNKDISPEEAQKAVYHLNAILPGDIVIHAIRSVKENAHCRFDALSRTYQYTVHTLKDPFIADMAYYFPYTLDIKALQETASLIMEYEDFQSFSKKNSQVLSFDCRISRSEWEIGENLLVYTVTGNRFLRGMVRGLVGTMLQAGRGKHDKDSFRQLIESRNAAGTDFSAPGKGLVLARVEYADDIFKKG